MGIRATARPMDYKHAALAYQPARRAIFHSTRHFNGPMRLDSSTTSGSGKMHFRSTFLPYHTSSRGSRSTYPLWPCICDDDSMPRKLMSREPVSRMTQKEKKRLSVSLVGASRAALQPQISHLTTLSHYYCSSVGPSLTHESLAAFRVQ